MWYQLFILAYSRPDSYCNPYTPRPTVRQVLAQTVRENYGFFLAHIIIVLAIIPICHYNISLNLLLKGKDSITPESQTPVHTLPGVLFGTVNTFSLIQIMKTLSWRGKEI